MTRWKVQKCYNLWSIAFSFTAWESYKAGPQWIVVEQKPYRAYNEKDVFGPIEYFHAFDTWREAYDYAYTQSRKEDM